MEEEDKISPELLNNILTQQPTEFQPNVTSLPVPGIQQQSVNNNSGNNINSSSTFTFQNIQTQPTVPRISNNSSNGLFFQASSLGLSATYSVPSSPFNGVPPTIGNGGMFVPASSPSFVGNSYPITPHSSFSNPTTPISENNSPTTFTQTIIPSSPALAYGLTEPVQVPDVATNFLNHLESMKNTQNEYLKKICSIQKNVLQNPQQDAFQTLNAEHEKLKTTLDNQLKQLEELDRNLIMTTKELKKWNYLQQEIQLQNMQLELYHQELQQLTMQPGVTQRWLIFFSSIFFRIQLLKKIQSI